MSPLDGLERRSKIFRNNRNNNTRVNFLSEKSGDLDDKSSSTSHLDTKPKQNLKRFDRPKISKISILKIVLILALIFLITGAMYLSEVVFSSADNSLSSLNKFNPFKQLARLVISGDKNLAGENSDRINFLLLGVGGVGHEGPYLTDTIMVASLKPSTAEVALISLPRDLIVPVKPGDWQKINQVYAFAKAEEGAGGPAITAVVERILDIKIHYYAAIDFSGFEKFIDDLGGAMITVERDFTDDQYPTPDFLTTSVSFAAGPQLMDGQTALIFARSRHGNNGEGSDFARSKRQQLILQAVKDKILSFSTLLNPKKISAIFELLDKHLETNLSAWQALKLGQYAQKITDDSTYRLVFDDSPWGLLEPNITDEGAYILQPKDGNYKKIQSVVANIFDQSKIKNENALIEIQNGTETPGLAYYSALYLQTLNFNIVKYSNATTQDYQRTIIYDLTDGEKKTTLKKLKDELNAYISKTVPDYIQEKYSSVSSTSTGQTEIIKPDILVILGLDYSITFSLPEPKATETASSTATDNADNATEKFPESIQE